MTGSYHAARPPTTAPGIGGRAFDYDASLDDIAATDGTGTMGSDPQFTVNMGFRPGTHPTGVFSSESMGFS